MQTRTQTRTGNGTNRIQLNLLAQQPPAAAKPTKVANRSTRQEREALAFSSKNVSTSAAYCKAVGRFNTWQIGRLTPEIMAIFNGDHDEGDPAGDVLAKTDQCDRLLVKLGGPAIYTSPSDYEFWRLTFPQFGEVLRCFAAEVLALQGEHKDQPLEAGTKLQYVSQIYREFSRSHYDCLKDRRRDGIYYCDPSGPWLCERLGAMDTFEKWCVPCKSQYPALYAQLHGEKKERAAGGERDFE